MNVFPATNRSAVRSLPSRLSQALVLSSLLVGASSAFSNIRELAVSDGESDQQRIQSVLLNDGSMVFVWEDQSGSDSDVVYRLFDPLNSQLSAPQIANADAAGDQVDPVISALFDGGFVIAFASRLVGGDYDVKFRRFDNSGAAVDVNDVLVNTTSAGSQQHPSVTTLDNGWFVVGFSGPGAFGQDLFFQRYGANGNSLDPSDMPLNTLGSDAIADGDQAGLRVNTFPEGGWMAGFEDRASGNMFAVRFSNAGAPYRDPQGAIDEFYFVLHDVIPNEQFGPSIAAFGDEEFAVAFNSDVDGTSSGRRVKLRVFDTGGPVTADIQVGLPNQRSQDPHVVRINDSRLVVAWKTLESFGGGSVWSVYAQEFDLNGAPIGGPILMHADQLIDRGRPHVIPWMDEGFAVAWESGGAGGNVAARTVAPVFASPGMMGVLLSGPPESLKYQISFLGFPGECYELQSADELNNWSTVFTTNAPAGSFQYVDPEGAITPNRFFRVMRKLSGL